MSNKSRQRLKTRTVRLLTTPEALGRARRRFDERETLATVDPAALAAAF
jgi:hypothetical protein